MTIDSTEREGIIIFKVSGHIDLFQVANLDEQVENYMRKGNRDFILDLIDVKEIKSSGIARVLNLARTLEPREGRLVLADLSPVTEHVLELARLKDVFEVYYTVDEAIKGIKSGPRPAQEDA